MISRSMTWRAVPVLPLSKYVIAARSSAFASSATAYRSQSLDGAKPRFYETSQTRT
jgi:hypothetical protein